MVKEKLTDDPTLAVSTACGLVGEEIGINRSTLRNWVQHSSHDSGQAPGTASDDKQRITSLEQEMEIRDRRANEFLWKASFYLVQAGLARR